MNILNNVIQNVDNIQNVNKLNSFQFIITLKFILFINNLSFIENDFINLTKSSINSLLILKKSLILINSQNNFLSYSFIKLQFLSKDN